jgi:hypothetical protein
VVGITVFDSFESDAVAANGEVPMPKPTETMLGGHAICVVGYRPDGSFIVRNSWSALTGATRAISTCPTPISRTSTSRPTPGRSRRAATACAGPPVVTASSASCAALLPAEWKQGVAGAPLPDGNSVGDWIAFGDAQTGKLDQANGRTKDAIGIVERCEARDAAAVKKARDARLLREDLRVKARPTHPCGQPANRPAMATRTRRSTGRPIGRLQ